MTIKGYPDQAKAKVTADDAGATNQFATVQPIRAQQNAADVIAHVYNINRASDAVEAASTTRTINATSHVALRGDIISFTSGALQYYEFRVLSVTTNTIVLAELMPVAPATSDTFDILRAKAAVVGSDGTLSVAFTDTTTATGSNQLAGSITGSALTGSYATIITLTFNARIVQFFNSCDQPITISLDSGTTAAYILEAGESPSIDLGAAHRHVASGVTIRAKHNGVTPANGTIRATAIG